MIMSWFIPFVALYLIGMMEIWIIMTLVNSDIKRHRLIGRMAFWPFFTAAFFIESVWDAMTE